MTRIPNSKLVRTGGSYGGHSIDSKNAAGKRSYKITK